MTPLKCSQQTRGTCSTTLSSPACSLNHLETWIAIGGGEFPAKTWSAMAATLASRAAFVSSLKSFIDTYSFQGIDLEWEFPDPPGSDAQNFVALGKEIKDVIACGILSAVPSDRGSVQGFDNRRPAKLPRVLQLYELRYPWLGY